MFPPYACPVPLVAAAVGWAREGADRALASTRGPNELAKITSRHRIPCHNPSQAAFTETQRFFSSPGGRPDDASILGLPQRVSIINCSNSQSPRLVGSCLPCQQVEAKLGNEWMRQRRRFLMSGRRTLPDEDCLVVPHLEST